MESNSITGKANPATSQFIDNSQQELSNLLPQRVMAQLNILGYKRDDKIHIRCLPPKGIPDEVAQEKGLSHRKDGRNHPIIITGTLSLVDGMPFQQDGGKEGEQGNYSNGLTRLLDLNKQGYGIYFVVNPGGETDEDITECRALFYEFDSISKDEQRSRLSQLEGELGHQATLIIETFKSLHVYFRLEKSITPGDFKIYQQRLIQHLGSDPAIFNPARLMRLAGFNHVRWDDGIQLEPIGIEARNTQVSLEKINAILPAWDEGRWCRSSGTADSTPAASPTDIRNLAPFMPHYKENGRPGWDTFQCPIHTQDGGQHSTDTIHINRESGAFSAHCGCDTGKIYAACLQVARAANPEVLPPDVPENEGKKAQRLSQADCLVKLVEESEIFLFHDEEETAWADVMINGIRQTHRLRAKKFKHFLSREFYREAGKTINSQSLEDALKAIEGKAQFDGPEIRTHIRLAREGNSIYLDLGNERWNAIEINASGWKIIQTPPIRFRRSRATLPLPNPEPGNIQVLRQILNIEEEEMPRLLAWLLHCFNPEHSKAILMLLGNQGTGKSTAATILKKIIDPDVAPLLSQPSGIRDLSISSKSSWLLAFDNLSFISNEMSDAFCRLSTGGGFRTRELHSNDEEVIFNAIRPIIFTGITELSTRSDLLDRMVMINLPKLGESRLSEQELFEQVEKLHPQLLGALLNAVSEAMRNLPNTPTRGLPRMTEYARWGIAGEAALGLEPGSFMASYQASIDNTNSTALEASPVAEAIIKFMIDKNIWAGTASELLSHLNQLVSELKRKSKEWPKQANHLSRALKRVAPNLESVGIQVSSGYQGRAKIITLSKSADGSENSSPDKPGNSSLVSTVSMEPSSSKGLTTVDATVDENVTIDGDEDGNLESDPPSMKLEPPSMEQNSSTAMKAAPSMASVDTVDTVDKISPLSNPRSAISKSAGRIEVDMDRIDLGYQPEMEIQPWKPERELEPYGNLKKLYLDIETSGLDPASDRIYSIGLLDENGATLISEEDERATLLRALAYLQGNRPDILVGHNLFAFDIPFIIERARLHEIPMPFQRGWNHHRDEAEVLRITSASFNGTPITFTPIYWEGVDIIDTFHQIAIWDKQNAKLEGYGLKDSVIALGLREERRIELSHTEIQNAWKTGDLETLHQYLLYDLEDTRLLADYLLPVVYYQMSVVPGLSLQRLATASPALKAQKIHESLYPNYFPQADDDAKYEGGFTSSKHGLYKNAAKIDVSSMYPSIMLRYGLCSRKDKEHRFLGVIQYLMEERLRLKELAKAGDTNAKDAEKALKITLNGSYGFFGTSGKSFNDREVAALITAYGRKILGQMIESMENAGAEIIEVDTDGIIFSHDDAASIRDRVQAALPSGINIGLEWQGKSIYCHKTKNYLIFNPDGSHEAVGIFRKRNNSRLKNEFTIEYVSRLLKSEEEAEAYYQEIRKQIEAGTMAVDFLQKTERIPKSSKRLLTLGNPGDKVTYYEGEEKRFHDKTGSPIQSKRTPTQSGPYFIEHYLQELKKLYDEVRAVVSAH